MSDLSHLRAEHHVAEGCWWDKSPAFLPALGEVQRMFPGGESQVHVVEPPQSWWLMYPGLSPVFTGVGGGGGAAQEAAVIHGPQVMKQPPS